MSLNRRETYRASIRRVQAFVLSDELRNSSSTVLKEKMKMLNAAFDGYREEHLAIVETVTDEDGMRTQNAAIARV